MKLFIVTYNTNYGLSVMIISATDIKEANSLAEKSGAWPGYECREIWPSVKSEVLIHEGS